MLAQLVFWGYFKTTLKKYNMTNSFEIVVTILRTIEEYKKGNINRTTLELIIKGAINLVEENNRYDFSKNCGCGNERIGETWCCNQCGLPVSK